MDMDVGVDVGVDVDADVGIDVDVRRLLVVARRRRGTGVGGEGAGQGLKTTSHNIHMSCISIRQGLVFGRCGVYGHAPGWTVGTGQVRSEWAQGSYLQAIFPFPGHSSRGLMPGARLFWPGFGADSRGVGGKQSADPMPCNQYTKMVSINSSTTVSLRAISGSYSWISPRPSLHSLPRDEYTMCIGSPIRRDAHQRLRAQPCQCACVKCGDKSPHFHARTRNLAVQRFICASYVITCTYEPRTAASLVLLVGRFPKSARRGSQNPTDPRKFVRNALLKLCSFEHGVKT